MEKLPKIQRSSDECNAMRNFIKLSSRGLPATMTLSYDQEKRKAGYKETFSEKKWRWFSGDNTIGIDGYRISS